MQQEAAAGASYVIVFSRENRHSFTSLLLQTSNSLLHPTATYFLLLLCIRGALESRDLTGPDLDQFASNNCFSRLLEESCSSRLASPAGVTGTAFPSGRECTTMFDSTQLTHVTTTRSMYTGGETERAAAAVCYVVES